MNGGFKRATRTAVAASLLFGGALTATVIGDSTPAWAQPTMTLYVALGGSGDCTSPANACGSIQTAITTATGGSYAGDDVTIDVAAGTYTENDTISASSLDSLTIAGAGESSTLLNGSGRATVVTVDGGTVNVSGITIENGNGTDGGGIDNSGTLVVSNTELTSNAGTDGGAIYNSGTLTVTDSALSGNSAGTDGGAIYNQASVTVEDSTLSANTAGRYGGGIENTDGTMSVGSSTVAGNSAGSDGGGIDIEGQSSPGPSTVENSTVTGDGAPYGGGIEDDEGPLTVGATIVAASTSGAACFLQDLPSFTDQGYNIDDDGSCGFTSPGVSDSGTIDSSLGSLADNGGTTQTVALEAGSPAIGLVTDLSLCPATDQRGAERPTSGSCDAGAYDTNGAPFDPSISAVTIGGTLATPTVTVSGSGFGTESDLGVPVPAYCGNSGFDYGDNFYFSDGWGAGQGSGAFGDCTGVIISSYSTSQITFTFGSGYGNSSGEYGTLDYGDSFQMNLLGGGYAGSVPVFSPAPTISSVTIAGTLAAPTVTVSGSGFGTEGDLVPPGPTSALSYCPNTDTGFDYDNDFSLSDVPAGWAAGQGGNCTGVSISSYSTGQITFTFGNGYGTGSNQYGALSPGDAFTMTVLGTTFNGTVPFSETPTIKGVTFGGDPTSPTVTVSGTGFDTLSDLGTGVDACAGTGYNYDNSFYFADATHPWQAGQTGNCIGLLISSYSNSQIVFTFGSEYPMLGSLSDGDSFSVSLFGVTYDGIASLGTGYTCAVSGISGHTSFPVVVSASPAPSGTIDAGGTFETTPSAQLTVPASVVDDFLAEGATSLTIASQTTTLAGLTSVGGSPSGAVDPDTESASATNLPLSDTLVADTPSTYATAYNPVSFQTGPGTGTVDVVPGAIEAEVTLVIGGTPSSRSISCAAPSGVAALGSVTVDPPASRPTFQVPPATPPLQNQVSAGTDGGWGATIANTSTVSVTGLSASVRVTDGHGTPTFDLAGMAASGTTCAKAGPGTLTCSIGTLAAGATSTLDVLVDTTGLPDGATITGTATVASADAGSHPTTLGAIGVVVVEGGRGTKAVAAPGIALSSTRAKLSKAKASVTLTLPTAKIKVKKRVGGEAPGGTGPSASGTVIVTPPPVAVTLESLAPTAEPALCPPTGSTKCEGNIIQVVGNFSLYTNKLDPVVAVVKFFYGKKVPAGTVYFLKPNGKTVDKLSACKKTASGYDTPCVEGKEVTGGSSAKDSLYAQDTVYFTGNDPAMGRR